MRENRNSDAARLQATTPEELLQWMSDNITYELANDEYGEEDDPPTKTAAEVIETGTGHCAEQSYLEQEVLEQLGYDTQLVFVKENNTKDDYGADGSAHMFLTFVDDAGNHYWFEHAMEHARGIHKYDSMDELLQDVADQWWRYDKDSDVLEVRFIPQPITGVDNWELAKRCHRYPVEAELDISNNVLEKEIPLEAEWDFDNKRVLDESLAPTIYFLSDKDMDGRTLTPRVPSNYMTRNGYEDGETPRVCFAKSIDGALKGLSQNLAGKEFYVHTPVAIDSRYLHTPSREEVPDVSITTEVWYTRPVKIKTVGKIKVLSDDGKDGLPYTYGDGQSAELYGWTWEWDNNPTEGALSEARKRKKKKRTRGHSVNYQPNVGDMSYTIDVFNRMMGNSHATGMAAADPVGASMTMTMMEELDSEPWYEGMTLDDKFHYLKHTFPHVDGNWALKVPEDIIDNIHDWAEALREVMHDNPTLAENAAIADGGYVVFAPSDGVTANYIDYSNSDSVDEWVAYLSGDDSQPTEEVTKEITDGIERDFLAVDKFNENINKIFNIVLGEPTEMSESKKINLRESIAALDHASENEYGLTALYEALELDATKKHKLAELLARGSGALAVYRKLVEWYDEEEEEEDDFTSYFVDDEDTCPECGMRYNDSGTCPHCDHGEPEVLTELGPIAGAVISAVAPVVVDKLLGDDVDREEDGDDTDEDEVLTEEGEDDELMESREDLEGHNWTMYSISNRENEKRAEELVYQLADDGFLPFDSKDTGSKYYVILRKRGEDGKGIWKAVKYGNTHKPEIIDITYEQATGREPLDDFHRLRRDLGRMLLPHDGLNEARSGEQEDLSDEFDTLMDELLRQGYMVRETRRAGSYSYTLFSKKAAGGGSRWKAIKQSATGHPEIVSIASEQAAGVVPLVKGRESRASRGDIASGGGEVLTELGPIAGAIISAVAPAVVDKVLGEDAEDLEEGLFGDYKPYGEFTEEDIELHKSIDWDARDYEEYPVKDDTFLGEAVLYTDNGSKRAKVTFMKFIRPNPIYPPYYRPVHNPFPRAVGPMYDGQSHGDYDVHNRYESQSVYDALSESYTEDEDKPFNKRKVFDELKRETREWTKQSDTIHYGFESEYKYALDILKKHYKKVEGTGDWHITFSEPLRKKK